MKRKNGLFLWLFIILITVIISILGIVIDSGLMIYYQHELDMATEAASVATISAYDRALYESEMKVFIDVGDAQRAAQEYLNQNFKRAKISKVTALADNTIKVETEYEHDFVFMRLFGFNTLILKSECTTIGG